MLPAYVATHQPWYLGSPVRRLRLASGLVLFTYVATHLIDHALCNASWRTADAMLLVQKWVWQGVVGTTLLYGALLIHMWLGLQALYRRRYFRWTRTEMLQLGLGLAFPALLANHLSVTRTALTLYGLNKGYVAELASLWVLAPRTGWLQIAVLIAAWTHGCIGLFFVLRLRRNFPAWQAPLLATAALLPVLALLGFVQGGREVARAMHDLSFMGANLNTHITGTLAQRATLAWLRDQFLIAYAIALALVILARGIRRAIELRRGLVVIFYPAGAQVRVPRGLTVLDASHLGRIAHASVCGGRGRCSTCRVHIVWAAGELAPPAPHEAELLRNIGADSAETRLACQLRATGNMQIVPLIPPNAAFAYIAGRAPRIPGEERFVVAMFVDLRGSTRLTEHRTPYDSVFLLGRFISAVSLTITQHGGRPVQFLGDGVLALFGLECAPDVACRQSLAALAALAANLADVADLFRQETQQDFGYGVGLHCGQAIVGEVGFGRDIGFTALGKTVNVAHRLQEVARDRGAVAVISDAVFACAGEGDPAYEGDEIALRGQARKVTVRVISQGKIGGDVPSPPNPPSFI